MQENTYGQSRTLVYGIALDKLDKCGKLFQDNILKSRPSSVTRRNNIWYIQKKHQYIINLLSNVT